MDIYITDEAAAKGYGERLGRLLRGGECIEMIGDVGVGKTTFVKGLATGLGVDEDVQSPSFTVSRSYEAENGKTLHHYDFYRLAEPGVVAYSLAESLGDPDAVTVIEWGETVSDVLPVDRVRLMFAYQADSETRACRVSVPDNQDYLKGFAQ